MMGCANKNKGDYSITSYSIELIKNKITTVCVQRIFRWLDVGYHIVVTNAAKHKLNDFLRSWKSRKNDRRLLDRNTMAGSEHHIERSPI